MGPFTPGQPPCCRRRGSCLGIAAVLFSSTSTKWVQVSPDARKNWAMKMVSYARVP